MTTEHGDASERLVEQRVRNRIIEYLELAASFEAQREYEHDVSIAHVPYEVINQWDDHVWIPLAQNPWNGDVYDQDEVTALSSFRDVWDAVATAIPDDYPSLTESPMSSSLLEEVAESAV